jgi:hypothetical protein
MCPARPLSFSVKEVPGFRKQRSLILASFENSSEAGRGGSRGHHGPPLFTLLRTHCLLTVSPLFSGFHSLTSPCRRGGLRLWTKVDGFRGGRMPPPPDAAVAVQLSKSDAASGTSGNRLKRAGLCRFFRASRNHRPVSIRFSLFSALLSK